MGLQDGHCMCGGCPSCLRAQGHNPYTEDSCPECDGPLDLENEDTSSCCPRIPCADPECDGYFSPGCRHCCTPDRTDDS